MFIDLVTVVALLRWQLWSNQEVLRSGWGRWMGLNTNGVVFCLPSRWCYSIICTCIILHWRGGRDKRKKFLSMGGTCNMGKFHILLCLTQNSSMAKWNSVVPYLILLAVIGLWCWISFTYSWEFLFCITKWLNSGLFHFRVAVPLNFTSCTNQKQFGCNKPIKSVRHLCKPFVPIPNKTWDKVNLYSNGWKFY